MVTVLKQVGAAWSPNSSRAPLPAQARIIEHPYTPVGATATSGTAANAIDGVNDTSVHTFWQTSGALPQSVTLDLGQSHPDVGMLTVRAPIRERRRGARAATSPATASWSAPTEPPSPRRRTGTWPADGKLHTAIFGPVAARYVRLEARAANGARRSSPTSPSARIDDARTAPQEPLGQMILEAVDRRARAVCSPFPGGPDRHGGAAAVVLGPARELPAVAPVAARSDSDAEAECACPGRAVGQGAAVVNFILASQAAA